MYADLDFWLALLKDDDWLSERAESLLAEHEDELTISLVTFVELFLVEERFAFDREQTITAMLELAAYPGDPDVVFQASENISAGLHTFDAFHAALADGAIISSDSAYDELDGIDRVRLEPADGEAEEN